ncbi:phytoene/squalene synthase family protein [Balneolaceae bacterium ANBcel3]|nr:phytoene/squalene synthase family protein [Balneolaceae bacterium ANBcel3]
MKLRSVNRSLTPELEEAYHWCEEVTRSYAKTFYFAARFLPIEKRYPVYAVYALCRMLDHLADEQTDIYTGKQISMDKTEEALIAWSRKLEETYQGKASDHPVLLALADVLKTHDISMHLPLLLIDGVRSDLVKTRYETFEEVKEYSYRVASVVGLMVCEIFGYTDQKALDYAVDLGIAMQLTNILRDVGEDLKRGRIYLPSEDMKRFGVSEDDLINHRLTSSFRDLMKFQIERARSYYTRSEPGIPLLSPDSRFPIYLARFHYAAILKKIESNGYQVFTKRAYLPFWKKVGLIPRILFIMMNGR